MPTPHRLTAFTDAVVAIAMTLLILPLLEEVRPIHDAGGTTGDFLADNVSQLLSFLLSFVIIAAFWWSHHRLYDHIGQLCPALVWLNTAWMATIVWMPVATAVVGVLPTDRLQVLLYIGAMVLSGVLSVASHAVLRSNPQLWNQDNPPTEESLRRVVVVTALFALALLIGLVVPGGTFFGLLVTLAAGPLRRLWNRRGDATATVQ